MSRLLEWVEVTPLRQKVLLIGLFLGLSVWGLYGIMVEPLAAEIDVLVGELHILDQKLKRDTPSIIQVDYAQEELSQWKLLVSQQEVRLGLEVSMSQVLSDMSRIADEAGVNLTLWKPNEGDLNISAKMKERHLQIHVEGGYHHLAQFLGHVQSLPKVMGVVAFSMTRVDTAAGTPTIRAIIDLMGYDGVGQTVANNRQDPVLTEHMARKG